MENTRDIEQNAIIKNKLLTNAPKYNSGIYIR